MMEKLDRWLLRASQVGAVVVVAAFVVAPGALAWVLPTSITLVAAWVTFHLARLRWPRWHLPHTRLIHSRHH